MADDVNHVQPIEQPSIELSLLDAIPQAHHDVAMMRPWPPFPRASSTSISAACSVALKAWTSRTTRKTSSSVGLLIRAPRPDRSSIPFITSTPVRSAGRARHDDERVWNRCW